MDTFFDEKRLAAAPPLDPSLYVLDQKSTAFFKATTGIRDDDELKEHILDVQRRAYALAPYPCIRAFSFAKFMIPMNPTYTDVLTLGREREGALFLDIGCGFGNDVRKIALDGFPVKQIVASDLRPELWNLGHDLFCSNPDSFPVTFLAGDVFDPAFLSPFASTSEHLAVVNLSSVSTLNDLRGKFSAIWAGSLFHLFFEKDQYQLARSIGSLLSAESGSILFGAHVALPSRGHLTGKISGRDIDMFCHDPDSWKEMWVGRSLATDVEPADNVDGGLEAAVFPPDSVKLDTTLVPMKSESGDRWVWIMMWSIARV